ncbi:MAG TPA: porin, partial [Wenzhouxiangella sp.]|nr:porin [Wenzhouxiangella sp.]
MTPKVAPGLLAGMIFSVFLLASLTPSGSAVAAEETTYLQLLGRAQVELANASGAIPEATGEDGLHLTDGWGAGRSNSHNWSGVFIDAGHRLGPELKVIGRFAFNFNMDGLPDGHGKYRDAYAGLQGSFGTVRLGRLETPYKLAGLGWDTMNATALQARTNAGRSGGALGHGGYHNDSVDYSASIHGVNVRAFY